MPQPRLATSASTSGLLVFTRPGPGAVLRPFGRYQAAAVSQHRKLNKRFLTLERLSKLM